MVFLNRLFGSLFLFMQPCGKNVGVSAFLKVSGSLLYHIHDRLVSASFCIAIDLVFARCDDVRGVGYYQVKFSSVDGFKVTAFEQFDIVEVVQAGVECCQRKTTFVNISGSDQRGMKREQESLNSASAAEVEG